MSGASTAAAHRPGSRRRASMRPRSYRRRAMRPAPGPVPATTRAAPNARNPLGQADPPPSASRQASSSPLRLGLSRPPALPAGAFCSGSQTPLRGASSMPAETRVDFADHLSRQRRLGARRCGKLPDEVIWIDLLNPTEDEKAFVESRSGLRVPTFEALSEIESSSRLIVDHGVIYLSTPIVAQGDTADYHSSPAGFILAPNLLSRSDSPIFPRSGRLPRRSRRTNRCAAAQGSLPP